MTRLFSKFLFGIFMAGILAKVPADEFSSEERSSTRASSASFQTEALLFSINDYGFMEQLPPLNGCNNDMREMKKWLIETGTDPRRITHLSDDPALAAFPPTSARLLEVLEAKIQQTCDRLIVVFACHGISADGKSFLCPQDGTDMDFSQIPPEETVAAGRRKNLIPLSDLLTLLQKSRAREVLLILDACRDHSEESSFMREFADLLRHNDTSFSRSKGSFAVITSCSLGQSALEKISVEGESRGLFLCHFLEGLRGKADFAGSYDGEITLAEAYNYAYSQVSSEASRRNHRQTPEIFMSSRNREMLLARYPFPRRPEAETDLQFLLWTGQILADHRYVRKANQVGVEALDCVLENLPNHPLAYSLRGSVHRKLGNFEQALRDLSQVGQKLQVYAQVPQPTALKSSPDAESENLSQKIPPESLLTITQIQDDYFYVEELNNLPLGNQCGWISRSQIQWSRRQAQSTLTSTPMQPQIRTVTPMNVGGGAGVHSGGRGGLDPFFKI